MTIVPEQAVPDSNPWPREQETGIRALEQQLLFVTVCNTRSFKHMTRTCPQAVNNQAFSDMKNRRRQFLKGVCYTEMMPTTHSTYVVC